MQVELKKPEKSKPFFELCNYWWMLCPPTLTDYARDNLPSAWGIATQGIDGCFKVVREAPLNADAEITPRFVYSILNAKLRNRYAETVRYESQEAVRMVAENENLFYEAAQINSAIKEKMREIILKWPV